MSGLKVGVLGLGAMGKPMACNLASAGLLEGVWNRTTEKALSFAMERLAKKACDVDWYVQDVTCFEPPQRFSLWHDRAVFHFLTEKGDRKKYIDVLRRALNPGGHVIIMAFALDGPKKCSGLDIVQYDAEKIQAELGDDFELIENGYEVHKTPSGKHQKFAYFHFVHKHETTPVT